jgi:hypothetical protein
MRLIRNLVGTVVLAVAFNACFKAPEFPVIPEIEFNDVAFRKGPAPTPDNPSPADTLVLSVNFKDGDGDLGLDATETDYPYNDKFYFKIDGERGYFPAGTPVENDGTLMSWHTKVTGNDTLPDFVSPYNCTNWELLTDPVTQAPKDTLYFELNNYHYNFFVDIFIQQPDNSFALYDWKKEFIYPNCQVNGFNGRFPILSKDLSQKTAQEGTIRYNMKSVAFNILFSIKVLKLRMYIIDRALNKSNVIETPPFTLQSIRK